MNVDLDTFERLLDYRFKNRGYLTEALTHKSFCVEESRHELQNERLELLGDSILNFVVADRLLDLFPNDQEGAISKKRAAMVNLNKLADIAVRFELEKYMRFGPGEIKQGNHKNPRIQGSCVEALIGAIYKDSSLDEARKWVLRQFSDADFEFEITGVTGSDFKTRLQELAQRIGLGTPVYELLLTTGPSHKPNFLVALKLRDVERSRGDGPSKKAAEQRAAEILLNELSKSSVR